MDNILALPDEEQVQAIRNEYSQKRPISDLVGQYDLIINVANVHMSTVQRIVWQATKGTPDIPFYVHEIPTILFLCNVHSIWQMFLKLKLTLMPMMENKTR